MKIYLISQSVNDGWDTYDSVVVCAKNEEEAKHIHPSEYYLWKDNKLYSKFSNGKIERDTCSNWCEISDIKVEYIGEAKIGMKKGVILASFNAG